MAEFEDNYYFKFGVPGGHDYDAGCSSAQFSEDYRGRTLAQNDVYFNRAYLNVDQYNYLASRINSIRKVRPLVFEDHYRMYPYRSGEMLVPKDTYTIEVAVQYRGTPDPAPSLVGWQTMVPTYETANSMAGYRRNDAAGGQGGFRGNSQLWGRSFKEAKQHWLRDHPAQDENDIVYWAEVDVNVAGSNSSSNEGDWVKEGDYAKKTADGSPCDGWEELYDENCAPDDFWVDNGSRCGKFVEWVDGDPVAKNGVKAGFWKNESCCTRHVDSNGDPDGDCNSWYLDMSQRQVNKDIWDPTRFGAASDVKLYHIAHISMETGWQMGNIRGGIMNDGDADGQWAAGDYIGEYMLDTSNGGGNGNTSMSYIRNPFREGSVDGRYPVDNVGGGGGGLVGIERHYHPWWLNIVNKLNAAVDAGYGGTKIPVYDQDDYPEIQIDGSPNKNWVGTMEESGVALSDSIQTHTYDVVAQPAGPELCNPNAGLGTITSPYPNLKKKAGTVVLSPDQEKHGVPVDPGNDEFNWGTFNTQQSVHLVKSSWTIKDSAYEIVDPAAYDHGLRYDILSDINGKETGVKYDLDLLPSPSRGTVVDTATNENACYYHCFKWDKLGFNFYDECLIDCVDDNALRVTTQRYLDVSSYLFEPMDYFDSQGGGFLLPGTRRIWHPDFEKAEDMMLKRGLGGKVEPRWNFNNWLYDHRAFFGDGICGDKPLHECNHPGGGERWRYECEHASLGTEQKCETEFWEYKHIGRVTDYTVNARHIKGMVKPYTNVNRTAAGSSLGQGGSTSLYWSWGSYDPPVPLLKRVHMLIHPWHFGLDADQANVLGEAENLPAQKYENTPDPADDYLAVRRQSSVGYRKGVQPNIYNSFKIPPYKTKGGYYGAGDKTTWSKGGVSAGDGSVEGYTESWDPTMYSDHPFDPQAQKVFWITAPDVQNRAKELGFHFEFRRLSVPYKMKEVNFTHGSIDTMYRESGNYHYLDNPWFADYNQEWPTPGMHTSLAYCQNSSSEGTLGGTYEPQAGSDWAAYNRDGCGLRDGDGKLMDVSSPDDQSADPTATVTVGPKADHADPIFQAAGRGAGGNLYGLFKKFPWILNEAGNNSNASKIVPDTAGEYKDFAIQLGQPNKSHMTWWGDYTNHNKIYKLGSLGDDVGATFDDGDNFCEFYGKKLSDSMTSDGAGGLNLWQLTLEEMTKDDIKDREDYCKLAFHEEVWDPNFAGHSHGQNPSVTVKYNKPDHSCKMQGGWWAEYDRRFGAGAGEGQLRTHVWGKDAANAGDDERRPYPFNVGEGDSFDNDLAGRLAAVAGGGGRGGAGKMCPGCLSRVPPTNESAHDLLVEKGESNGGTFEFELKGLIPHVKKSYIFTTAQSAAETQWVRPIGHATVKHISKGFNNYNVKTTDYVKKQRAFSCEAYKDAGGFGGEWERDQSCEPHRFENVRLDNGGMQWTGNMIFGLTSLPQNVLVESDAMPSYWGFDATTKRIYLGPDGKHKDGPVYDNTRLLTEDPFLWTVAARIKGNFGVLHKVQDWKTHLPIVTSEIKHSTEGAIAANDHEGRYQEVSNPEGEGAKEGKDYIAVAGIPVPFGRILLEPSRAGSRFGSVWYDTINFYGGTADEPGFADMRRGGGFAFIGGPTRNTDQTEINNYGTTVSPYDVGLGSPDAAGPRSNTKVNGAFAACSPIAPIESGRYHGWTEPVDDDHPTHPVSATDVYIEYDACPEGADDFRKIPDCVVNNYFQPVYGDGGYAQFGPPNPGRTCDEAWDMKLVECITQDQETGCFMGTIDVQGQGEGGAYGHNVVGDWGGDDDPGNIRIGCFGGDGTDSTVDVPVPIAAQLIDGYSVKPRVIVGVDYEGNETRDYIGDNQFYMTIGLEAGQKQNCGAGKIEGKEDDEGDPDATPPVPAVSYRGDILAFVDGRRTQAQLKKERFCDPFGNEGQGGQSARMGVTNIGSAGSPAGGSFNSYPFGLAMDVNMGAGASFYNINWYEMLDNYDQGAILSVGADADYKKEMLKLLDNRNPDALLYQDYTDFYPSYQYNKIFRYEEKDFVYTSQSSANGSSISALAPYFLYPPGPGGGGQGVEGPGQSQYKIATFLKMETEHFGGNAEGQTRKAGGWSASDRKAHGTPMSNLWRTLDPTTVLKTQSMPMADTDFIAKALAGDFGGHLGSLHVGDKPMGRCPNCGGTDYWIGNSAATSAVVFYIENMIDLSPEASDLGGLESLSWGSPDLTPIDPDPVCANGGAPPCQ